MVDEIVGLVLVSDSSDNVRYKRFAREVRPSRGREYRKDLLASDTTLSNTIKRRPWDYNEIRGELDLSQVA